MLYYLSQNWQNLLTALLVGLVIGLWFGWNIGKGKLNMALVRRWINRIPPNWYPAVFGIGWVMAVVSAVVMSPPSYRFDDGLLWVIAVMIAFAVGAWLAGRYTAQSDMPDAPPQTPSSETAPLTIRWRALIGGIAALGVLTFANLVITGLTYEWYTSPLPVFPVLIAWWSQFGLLVMGVVLTTVGMSGKRLQFPRRDAEMQQESPFNHRREMRFELAALVIVLLIGAAARFWNLEQGIQLYVDELHFTDAVVRLQEQPDTDILLPFSGIAAFSWVFPVMQRLSVNVFGATLANMRLVSAVCGTLTILAVYGLAKWGVVPALARIGRVQAEGWYLRALPVLAALLIATFPPHIHFSRLALNNIADPLFGTLALAFIARGWQSGAQRDFALAGAALALTQLFYEGGRLLFPPVALVLVVALALTTPFTAARRRGVFIFVVTAALVALPFYLSLSLRGVTLTSRFAEKNVLIYYVRDMFSDFQRWFAIYFRSPLIHLLARPDGSHFYYGGQTGLLLPITLPLFLGGVGYALWRALRVPIFAALLLWVAGTVIGNSLIGESDWTARFAVVLPVLPLWILIGLTLLPATLRIDRQAARIAVIGVGVLLSLAQIYYYFALHLPYYNRVDLRHFPDYIDVIERTRDLPFGTHVYVVTDEIVLLDQFWLLQNFWGNQLNNFLVPTAEFTPERIANLPLDRPYAFFVLPDDAPSIRLITHHFGALRPQSSPFDTPPEFQYVLLFYEPEP